MKAKSGTKITAVKPIDPAAPEAADVADPGTVAKIKAEQLQSKSGKYGSTPAPTFTPAEDQSAEEEEKTGWIEVEMVDEEGQPIAGERYEVTLPDGSVSSGTLDGSGLARIEGFEPGNCEITFPGLDKDAWEPA